jgi:predicted Holliday junction resolvase-like endonuclease
MTDILGTFQYFRRILCMCPCCGDIVRLSDLHLRSKKAVAKTWLDNFEKKRATIEKKTEKFDEIEDKLREQARLKGRKDAQKVFNKAISDEFTALKLDPFDIKPVLHPIDFLVFKDMNKNGLVDRVILLSKDCKNQSLCKFRGQVKDAIDKKRYEWQVARINADTEISLER